MGTLTKMCRHHPSKSCVWCVDNNETVTASAATLAQSLLQNKLLCILDKANKEKLDFDAALAAAKDQLEATKRYRIGGRVT